jgi:hypothetical protein
MNKINIIFATEAETGVHEEELKTTSGQIKQKQWI